DPRGERATSPEESEPAESAGQDASEPASRAPRPESRTEGRCGGGGAAAEPADAKGMGTDGANPEGGADQQWTWDPDEPSDADWRDSIPLRTKLEPEARKDFDEAALLWRRTQRAREQIRAAIDPSREEIGRSPYFQMARNRLRLRLLFGALIEPPHQWK